METITLRKNATMNGAVYEEKHEVRTLEDVSDGYHTVAELYDHRLTLWIALCRAYSRLTDDLEHRPWRSKVHSDGTSLDGWFLLGIGHNPGKQITYHVPLDRWSETDFADTFEKASNFDGHTVADVVERLKTL